MLGGIPENTSEANTGVFLKNENTLSKVSRKKNLEESLEKTFEHSMDSLIPSEWIYFEITIILLAIPLAIFSCSPLFTPMRTIEITFLV